MLIHTIKKVRKQVAVKLSQRDSWSDYWSAKRLLKRNGVDPKKKAEARRIVKHFQKEMGKDKSMTRSMV